MPYPAYKTMSMYSMTFLLVALLSVDFKQCLILHIRLYVNVQYDIPAVGLNLFYNDVLLYI